MDVAIDYSRKGVFTFYDVCSLHSNGDHLQVVYRGKLMHERDGVLDAGIDRLPRHMSLKMRRVRSIVQLPELHAEPQCTGPFSDRKDCPVHKPTFDGPQTYFELRDQAIKAMPEAAKFERLLMEIGHEFLGAQASNAPMHSLHEGLSVIEEEVHELRLEVYKTRASIPTAMRWLAKRRFRSRRWRCGC